MLDYYLFKEVYNLFLEGKTTEAKRILAELQEQYIEIADENGLLRTQVKEYEDILYLAKNLEFDGFSYWLKTGTIKQGPFCRDCYDHEGMLIRLHEFKDGWKCPTCGEDFKRSDGVAAVYPTVEPEEKPAAQKVIHLFK